LLDCFIFFEEDTFIQYLRKSSRQLFNGLRSKKIKTIFATYELSKIVYVFRWHQGYDIYSPYMSVMSLRIWAAEIFDNLPILFLNLCLLTVRIWSTATSAFLFAHRTWNRVFHCGCSFVVRGHTTTVSRYLFISSWLTITTGLTFFISLPVVGFKSAKNMSYFSIFKVFHPPTRQGGLCQNRPNLPLHEPWLYMCLPRKVCCLLSF